jgi:hypothetical protein
MTMLLEYKSIVLKSRELKLSIDSLSLLLLQNSIEVSVYWGDRITPPSTGMTPLPAKGSLLP